MTNIAYLILNVKQTFHKTVNYLKPVQKQISLHHKKAGTIERAEPFNRLLDSVS